MTADDPVLEILREALEHQSQATEKGFSELKAEMAATRKQVLLIAVLGMLLQAAMVGVGFRYVGPGGSVKITPSSTIESTDPESVPAGGPYFDFFPAAQATTDGQAPAEDASYGDAEPQR